MVHVCKTCGKVFKKAFNRRRHEEETHGRGGRRVTGRGRAPGPSSAVAGPAATSPASSERLVDILKQLVGLQELVGEMTRQHSQEIEKVGQEVRDLRKFVDER